MHDYIIAMHSLYPQIVSEFFSWRTLIVLLLIFIGSQYERPAKKLTGRKRKYKIILSGILFGLVVAGVNIILLYTCWIIHFISPKLKRKLNSKYAQMLFIRGTSFIFPSCKIVFTGDKIRDDDSQAIVISNHQVDADWWFPWSLLRACEQGSYVKFILKSELGKIPLIGWGLKGLNFIMLQRDWMQDKSNLTHQLETFVKDGAPLRVVMFPEGTTINITSMEKSAEYAKKEDRPIFKHLLLPRTTGFNACVDCLKDVKKGVIYDFTIAYEGYSGEIPTWDMGYDRNIDVLLPSMEKLMAGDSYGRAHIHVECHSIQDAVKGGTNWLDSIWIRKDKLLEEFIKNQKFPGEEVEIAVEPDEYIFFSTFMLLVVLWYTITWTVIPILTFLVRQFYK